MNPHETLMPYLRTRLQGATLTPAEAEEIAAIAKSRARAREVRFYMSDDGEVLSNKRFPVDKPELRVVMLDMAYPKIEDYTSPQGPPIKEKVYKAQTIRLG